jgi:hypothetical protein
VAVCCRRKVVWRGWSGIGSWTRVGVGLWVRNTLLTATGRGGPSSPSGRR